MTKILIIGHNPLPFENSRKLWSGGLRTWHFVKPLADAGHEICLVCIDRFEGAFCEKPKKFQKIGKNLNYYSLTLDELRSTNFLNKIYKGFNPDCIIGINSLPSKIACEIRGKPLWADLNGCAMAEMQSKAHVYKSNQNLKYGWYLEQPTIKRADVFSVAEMPHKYFLIGELATIGRLNKETCGYEFVHYIPNAIDVETEYAHKKSIFRNKLGKDDFVVLWTGGYNNWADIDTLFEALEKAMEKNPKIKFVSTGGKISGHSEKTFERFIQRINSSRFKKRFIFLGWLSNEDLQNCYFEADIGINADKSIYETEIGGRNRLLEMMKACLPVLTSLKSEISHTIRNNGIGYTFAPENSEELSELILKLSKTPKVKLKKTGKKAKQYVFENFSYEKTTEKLLEWAKNPRHSPDYGKKIPLIDIFYLVFSKIERFPLAWKILRQIKKFI